MPAASARTKCACVVTTISQVNLVCRQRPARSKVLAHGHQAGRQVQCAWGYFRDANTGAGQGITDLAAAVQLRLRVAVVFGLQALQ
jgi:hypothetical protein